MRMGVENTADEQNLYTKGRFLMFSNTQSADLSWKNRLLLSNRAYA